MSTSLLTATPIGASAVTFSLEVDILRRLPSLVVAGLPGPAVREIGDTLRSAFAAEGFTWPRGRVVASLHCANARVNPAMVMLPLAIAIMHAGEGKALPKATAYLGEVYHDGTLRPCSGLMAAVAALAKTGVTRVVVPRDAPVALNMIPDVTIHRASTLGEAYTLGEADYSITPKEITQRVRNARVLDYADLRGLDDAKDALAAAAVDRKPVLLLGPPGAGKTALAARAGGLLPPLTEDERLQVYTIMDAVSLLQPSTVGGSRPVRAPHHTISAAGMLGSATLRPGEASLAHEGILFLDELPEFSRRVLEALSRSAADGEVVITRAAGTVKMPARYWLIAAASPCPCGAIRGVCRCTDDEKQRYDERLRSFCRLLGIETVIEVPALDPETLAHGPAGVSTAAVLARRKV